MAARSRVRLRKAVKAGATRLTSSNDFIVDVVIHAVDQVDKANDKLADELRCKYDSENVQRKVHCRSCVVLYVLEEEEAG